MSALTAIDELRAIAVRRWLHLRSRWATPAWLNALSDEHKQVVATGPFPRQLRELAAAHVATFSWVTVPHAGQPEIHNASMFFLDCGEGPFAVTAGHVYRHYRAQREAARRIVCQVGDFLFDPEERRIDDHNQPDIATFRITYQEVSAIGKMIVTHGSGAWPPVPPAQGCAVIVCGFPGYERLVQLRENLTPSEINFGFYYANTPVTVSLPDQITCRFERESWVDSFGQGLPAAGYNLGGISGAPLLKPEYRNRRWTMSLAGVVTEAHCDEHWEQIAAVTSAHLLPDGRIQARV